MKNIFLPFSIVLLVLVMLSGSTRISAQKAEFPTLDSLPEALDSLPEYQVKSFVRHLADQALEIQNIYDRQASQASLEREMLDAQLAAAEADTLATKESRKSISKALKAAKNAERDAGKQLKKAEKSVGVVLEVAEMDSSDLRKNLPKAYKKIAALIPKPVKREEAPISDVIGVVAVSDPSETPDEMSMTPDSEQAEETDKKTERPKKKTTQRPSIKSYDPAADVMFNPPPRPCKLTLDTRDAFSGERRREVAQEEIFRFTNPNLKTYFPDQDQIICNASLAANSGTYLLQLYFTINDANAQRSFGNLPRNGVAILKLLDGETFTLYNLRADEGKPSADKKQFSFTGQYVIDSGMLKKMRKSLLDKLRIAWSTGYEDYDVQNVDFLVRQLGCLQNN